MLNQGSKAWLGCCLVTIIAATGCSGDAQPSANTGGPTGSLSLQLDLIGSAQIDEVWYRIVGDGMPPMTGFIDTSAPGATASVEVFGLAPGFGYLVELRAIADDGTSCEGSAPFDVQAGVATPVGVMINCKPPERFGSVRVNGKLNVCANLAKVIVAPLQTSLGSRIDLSAGGTDAEDDLVRYRWSATGGPIQSFSSPDTQYTCASLGRQFVRVEVSDDNFTECVDPWEVEVRCVSSDGGMGGSGGSGGSGGTGGSPLECMPPRDRCMSADIDPVVEDPTCTLNEPPNLPEGCDGSESTENPESCTTTGNESRHQAQMLAVAPDCNTGFNLDDCDGNTCIRGGLSPGEGLDGVDNALTGLGPVLVGVGANLGGVDQALYDGLCDGSIDWSFIVDTNPAENCVNVLPVYDGIPADPVALNLSDSGCISGTLGTVPLSIAGVQGEIGNATIRGTADVAQGFNVSLGGTADAATAIAIAETLLQGAGAVIAQVFDIDEDLQADLANGCNALSLTFDVGGTLVADSAEGACTDPENAAVYQDLEYLDSDGVTHTGSDAAEAIASECIFGSNASVPTNPGCPSKAQAVLICGGRLCPSETIDALAHCVQACTQEVIEEATGSQLSTECVACYGDRIGCTMANCATAGCTVPDSSSCIACNCDHDCTPAFDRCTGLPPDGSCN